MADLRKTVATAQRSMENLDAAISEVQPGLHKFSTSTMPAVDLLVRDLRTMSKSPSGVAVKLDKQGAGSVVGSPKLTDYKPNCSFKIGKVNVRKPAHTSAL